MRRTATFIALLLTALATAQVPDLGTKADIVVNTPEQPAPLVGGWDMVQMLVALAIVFALLKWALPKVVARMNKKLVTNSDSSITVEESANFGGGSLQIVSARGRTLLLCVSQNGVTFLTDLTKEAAKQEDPAFFELMDNASAMDDKELRAVVEIEEPEPEADLPQDDTQAMLARLERLTG